MSKKNCVFLYNTRVRKLLSDNSRVIFIMPLLHQLNCGTAKNSETINYKV